MSERPSTFGELPGDGTVLTTAEYLRTAESLRVQELVYGTLYVADSPSPKHQQLLFDLAVLLKVFVQQNKLGTIWIAPLDVILDAAQALIVQPDLFFISKQRQHIVTDHVWGAPDMVLEVLSPHPRIGDLEQRIGWFAKYGVRECWLVHQLSKEIEILQLTGTTKRRTFRNLQPIESTVLPGFRVAPALIATMG
ncbi:MAG: Uma2 family endonuclease [Acidobacteriota bacterium]|nr:Uma2 family endonuclease [Acidobacteriota bacterium]